jgi:hypothetical protein
LEKNSQNNFYFEISLESTEKEMPEIAPDPYVANNERVIAGFQRLGDVSDFQLSDISRILRLLKASINAWSLYTSENMWKTTGYDGPQVPRYPWKNPDQRHELSWEKGEK